jgi:hypothetical protein
MYTCVRHSATQPVGQLERLRSERGRGGRPMDESERRANVHKGGSTITRARHVAALVSRHARTCTVGKAPSLTDNNLKFLKQYGPRQAPSCSRTPNSPRNSAHKRGRIQYESAGNLAAGLTCAGDCVLPAEQCTVPTCVILSASLDNLNEFSATRCGREALTRHCRVLSALVHTRYASGNDHTRHAPASLPRRLTGCQRRPPRAGRTNTCRAGSRQCVSDAARRRTRLDPRGRPRQGAPLPCACRPLSLLSAPVGWVRLLCGFSWPRAALIPVLIAR